MRQDLKIAERITANTTPSRAWEVLTNPEIIKEYLFGTETITDWQIGSEIIFQGEYEGTSYKDKGIILQNIPGERITYSYWSGFSGLEDKPENHSTIHYTIRTLEPGKIEFTWEQIGFGTEEGYQHSLSGMDAFMEQIKAIMER
jgi:uncharacterized protein YndB with AHSA1/START domain